MKSTENTADAEEIGSRTILSYEQQQRLDQLAVVIGGEQAARDQLAEIEAEIARSETALVPVRGKRVELQQRLSIIEQAKSDARAIKAAPAVTITRKSGSRT